jgi:hypothetical protein
LPSPDTASASTPFSRGMRVQPPLVPLALKHWIRVTPSSSRCRSTSALRGGVIASRPRPSGVNASALTPSSVGAWRQRPLSGTDCCTHATSDSLPVAASRANKVIEPAPVAAIATATPSCDSATALAPFSAVAGSQPSSPAPSLPSELMHCSFVSAPVAASRLSTVSPPKPSPWP